MNVDKTSKTDRSNKTGESSEDHKPGLIHLNN